MKKIALLVFSTVLISLISTASFAGTACTPGTSNFCACYTSDLCQGTQCNVKGIINSMKAFKSYKGHPAGIPSACAFGCVMNGDTSAQCVTDCVNDTNYFIGNCSFTAANLP